MKAFVVFLILLLQTVTSPSQNLVYTNFQELAGKMKIDPKPVIIKLYTNWCTYCKLQDEQLKNRDTLSAYIQKNFYILNFNAESREDVAFNNTVYKFKPQGLSGGINELTLSLARETKELSYPYWVILDDKYNIRTWHQGYLKNKNLMLLLKSVVESKNLSLK